MDWKLIVKSFIIGIGKIIPGVSGAMLAILLNVYEDLIEAVTGFFNNPKKHFYLLLNFSLGLFLAIFFFSRIIRFLLNNFYYSTMFLFIGLFLGTLFEFKGKIKQDFKHNTLFIITLFLMLFLNIFPENQGFTFNGSLIHYTYVFSFGMIDALTSIIPGISGTVIFMLLGVYEHVLWILGNPWSLQFILYGLGLIFGIIITCYLMKYLLTKYKSETHSILFAFMIGSLLILLIKIISFISFGKIILLFLGFIIGKKFN